MIVTEPLPKPLIGSLKIAVNRIGVVLVGSAWAVPNGSEAEPWLTVTVGAVLSILTVLLPEDPGLPAASVWLAAKVYVPSADSGVAQRQRPAAARCRLRWTARSGCRRA